MCSSVMGLAGTITTIWLCFGSVLKSVDNTGMSLLLLSSTYTESRPFLLLTPPHQQVAGGEQKGKMGPNGTVGPNSPKGYPVPYGIVLSI